MFLNLKHSHTFKKYRTDPPERGQYEKISFMLHNVDLIFFLEISYLDLSSSQIYI